MLNENPVTKKEQKPNTCYYCDVEFTDTDELAYFNEKIMHKKCKRAATNKLNGRPFLCPKCKGEGFVKNPEAETLTRIGNVVQGVGCDLCGGFGYTSKEFVPVTQVVGYVEK